MWIPPVRCSEKRLKRAQTICIVRSAVSAATPPRLTGHAVGLNMHAITHTSAHHAHWGSPRQVGSHVKPLVLTEVIAVLSGESRRGCRTESITRVRTLTEANQRLENGSSDV